MGESKLSNVSNAELLQNVRDAAQKTKGFKRINALFDAGSFNEIDSLAKSDDNYSEAVAGYGTIEGCPAYAFAQNCDIDGGAMSKAQASKIKKVYELAVKTGAPVIGIYDSKGGKLKQGSDILAAYGEILLSANNLSGVVPQISIVLGACVGTSAMIAAGADIVVMSKKAELTINTNGENSSAEEAEKLGICQIVKPDDDSAISTVRKIITLLPSNNLSGTPVLELHGANNAVKLENLTDNKEVINEVCDENSFIEFSSKFGTNVNTGLAEIDGTTVGVVSLSGIIDADACSKAARFVMFCDAFSLPIVTFVNAEKFTTLREASKLSCSYSEATTAKITVITGSAYGPVYIAIAGRGANADYTLAWPNAVVSALAPETGAIFLWNDRLKGSKNPIADRKKLIEEYKETEASPFSAAANGLIEDIIKPEDTRIRIITNLEMLSSKRVSRLPKKHSNIQR